MLKKIMGDIISPLLRSGSTMSNNNRGNTGFGAAIRNAPGRVANYAKGAGGLITGLIGIFVVIVVGLIVYWVYQSWQKSSHGDDANPILIDGSINAFDPKWFRSWKLPETGNANSPSMAFTISFWMYIADWNYRFGEAKAIFIKGHPNGQDPAPGMWLGAEDNVLRVRMRTYTPVTHWEGCDVANIPLQKWVHVCYVLDNRVSDVYINGKLERSCVLKRLPWLNNGDFWLIPPNPLTPDQKQYGFFGQLSSVRYFSSALQPVDVARLYNEGPHVTKGLQTKDDTGAAGAGSGLAPSCPQTHPGTSRANPSCPTNNDDGSTQHRGFLSQAEKDVSSFFGSGSDQSSDGTMQS